MNSRLLCEFNLASLLGLIMLDVTFSGFNHVSASISFLGN